MMCTHVHFDEAKMNPLSLRKITSQALRHLPLQALTFPHSPDDYLQAINPLWSTATVRARVIDVFHPTTNATTIRLQPNAHWRGFKAGQFVPLTVEVDGVRHTRCYSPANSAHDRSQIELTIRAHDKGLVSQHIFNNIQRGDIVELGEAAGDFHLPAQRPEALLLISGGSGITPVISMLRTLADENRANNVHFLHFAPTPELQLYADELAELQKQIPDLNLHVEYINSDTSRGFDAKMIAELVPDHAARETYVCGPEGLMDAVRRHWNSIGRAESVHSESFVATPRAANALDAESASGEMRLSRSERIIENDGRSILDQAEAAGLRPQSGCRMGICATCTCRKTSGTVRNLLDGTLSHAGEGDIKICVSQPVGDVTIDL